MPHKKKTPADITKAKRVKKSDAEMDSILDSADELLGRVYDQQEQSGKKTFKGRGALGKTPYWFQEQEYHFSRLSNNRAWLKNLYSLKEIRKMMAEYRKHTIHDTPASLDTAEYGHVSVVCFYDDVIAARKEKGLEMLLGKGTAKAIKGSNTRKEKGLLGVATMKDRASKRKKEIIAVLNDFNSNRRNKSDDQIINDAIKHFMKKYQNEEDDKRVSGYGKSTLRSIFNNHLKGK